MTRKSLLKKIILSLGVVVLLLAILVLLAFRKIYTPTTGPHIIAYANPAKALLVIDVQEDYTGVNGRKPPLLKNVDNEINAINRLIDKAANSGMHVVYIRQLFDNNILMRNLMGRTIEGLPGTELDPRIRVASTNDFTKKISDAFSNPQLDRFLINNRVDELYLVGLDAAYCVHKTALGALKRGYQVTVVKDAVMSQKDLSKIFEQYKTDGIRTMVSKDLL